MFIIGVICLLKVLFPNNLRQTKTTFWRAPSEHREELAWFSCRCVFYTAGHSINDALALRGKGATGGLVMRLPFPLDCAQSPRAQKSFLVSLHKRTQKPCTGSNLLAMPLMKSQARNVGKQLQIKQELLLQLMNSYYVHVSLWDSMLCVKGNLIKWYQFSLIETRFFPGFGYARLLGISPSALKIPRLLCRLKFEDWKSTVFVIPMIFLPYVLSGALWIINKFCSVLL